MNASSTQGKQGPWSELAVLLETAVEQRRPLFDSLHESACRLFNGFTEGYPDLTIDLYARTLVLYNYADPSTGSESAVKSASEFLLQRLDWLRAVIVKTRNASTLQEQRGLLVLGEKPDTRVREHDVWYAIDLQMNADSSLYLDTRNLRRWLIAQMKGRSVLNTFAYTGSLGVAALAGGASRVVQSDLKRRSLNVAKTSYALNGFAVRKPDFIAGDFFRVVAGLKRAGQQFDCVILDPPFFSTTSAGRVDQVHEAARLINKVRPLVRDGGLLIAINNALYLTGEQYMESLQGLAADGYLEIREIIPVPADSTGYPATRRGAPMLDPSPFNHSTKIAVLEVRRKHP